MFSCQSCLTYQPSLIFHTDKSIDRALHIIADDLPFMSLGTYQIQISIGNTVRYLQHVSAPVIEYQQKKDYLYSQLREFGYSVMKPQGAFYMFPKSPLEDEVIFANELLQWRVLVAPGRRFGAPGYFRIAYCVDDSILERSVVGFREAARKYNNG